MPWKESISMSQRHEFVLLATSPDANFSQLCRRFQISRKTGYKWRRRFLSGGSQALADLSRRPSRSPRRTQACIEEQVIALRSEHPRWGGRKLRARLQALGHGDLPAPSTMTAILHRQQQIRPDESALPHSFRRFEHPHPNDLWQMDFKGDFSTAHGRCYPLTVVDDHSRFSLSLRALASQHGTGVQAELTEVFRRYGLPWRMTMDNGSPWGVFVRGRCCWTQLTVWLLRLGIHVSHSRPHHPQTQGKAERFHRTLKLELLRDYAWRDLSECQHSFDHWHNQYNCERPHEALEMAVPASRYQQSVRPWPEQLPAVEYAADHLVRRVGKSGVISLHQQSYFIGEAFRGLDVGLRPTTRDGQYEVYFCHQQISSLDLREPAEQR